MILTLPYGIILLKLEQYRIIALTGAIIIISMDKLDGLLARHFKCTSSFGAIIDALADDVFLATSWIILYIKGAIPIGFLILLLIQRPLARLFTVIIKMAKKRWHLEHIFGDRLSAVNNYIAILWILAELPAQREIITVCIILMYIGVLFSVYERSAYVNSS